MFLFISERGRKREGEIETLMRGKHLLAASCMPPIEDQAQNPGLWPDLEQIMTSDTQVDT